MQKKETPTLSMQLPQYTVHSTLILILFIILYFKFPSAHNSALGLSRQKHHPMVVKAVRHNLLCTQTREEESGGISLSLPSSLLGDYSMAKAMKPSLACLAVCLSILQKLHLLHQATHAQQSAIEKPPASFRLIPLLNTLFASHELQYLQKVAVHKQ